MASDTGIANVALRLLKANRIVALTDGSNNANAANDVFASVRDGLLRAHNWNFATKRQKLAKSATTPVSGFDNAFPLPSDWIRTVHVHSNDAEAGNPPLYREEELDDGGVIVTDVDELWMRYIYRVTNPNRMAADFQAAFAHALAVAIPGVSNSSAAELAELRTEARSLLNRAKHSDALGSSPERRPPGSWITSRGGSPSGHSWPH